MIGRIRGMARAPMASHLEPGQFVRHPGQPDWGEGQVQSVVGERVTVNFENAGKVLINARAVTLEVVED
jgi:hypothetical protein